MMIIFKQVRRQHQHGNTSCSSEAYSDFVLMIPTSPYEHPDILPAAADMPSFPTMCTVEESWLALARWKHIYASIYISSYIHLLFIIKTPCFHPVNSVQLIPCSCLLVTELGSGFLACCTTVRTVSLLICHSTGHFSGLTVTGSLGHRHTSTSPLYTSVPFTFRLYFMVTLPRSENMSILEHMFVPSSYLLKN